jgi:hypothetical protein
MDSRHSRAKAVGDGQHPLARPVARYQRAPPRFIGAAVEGGGKLERVVVRIGSSGDRRTLAAAGMFVFIGALPRPHDVRFAHRRAAA